MTYRLALLSPIPVVCTDRGFSTLDLWAVDLAEQLQVTSSLVLICPMLSNLPSEWSGHSLLPEGIQIINSKELHTESQSELLKECDVVQVFGGQNWRASRLGYNLISEAKRQGVTSIVGLSSNRARTALMNTVPRRFTDVPRVLRALINYCDIRLSYRRLTATADGTFIVGDGIRSLVAKKCTNLHVGTASWIHASDIAQARIRLEKEVKSDHLAARRFKMCIASRLEPMKGVHIGINALALLKKTGRRGKLTMTIFGEGKERERLGEQVKRLGLEEQVVFGGTLAYPFPFLEQLGQHGIVVLSNLNDEQPRLIFDAISRGCIPIYPNTKAYTSIGLPSVLAYDVGNAASMAAVIEAQYQNTEHLGSLHEALLKIAERHTLESMHAQRAVWITSLIRRVKVPSA